MAKIIDRLFRAASRSPPRRPEAAPALPNAGSTPSDAPQLLFGVDFGTAFTKVVWRDFGGRVGVAPVGPQGRSIAPSVVWVDGSGGLHLADPGGARAEEFLKMRLAPWTHLPSGLPEPAALSVFFVGSILRAGFASARNAFRGRPVAAYAAALGCPAQFCDDGRVSAFQKVAAQAWRWAGQADAPRDLTSLLAWMKEDPGADAAIQFEARAEVAAAVDCFVMRPDTEEGRYGFLDIGAGTLDGACFKVYREQGRTKITVLSSAVKDLGVEMLLRQAALGGQPVEALRRQLFSAGPLEEATWARARGDVRNFVELLLAQAREKDNHGSWLASPDARPRIWQGLEEEVALARRLPVFFGGGGMTSELYRAAAHQAARNLRPFDIPLLALGEVLPPEGFEGVSDAPFHRFAVAYGLTRPFTEAPALVLPHSVQPARPPIVKPTRDRLGVDYADSKDAYD